MSEILIFGDYYMEFIFELILELFLESGMEVGKNKKVSKWIRYPILALVIVFFIIVLSLIFFMGIMIFQTNILASLFIIGVGFIMLVGTVLKFRKLYLELMNNQK